jgi:CrcB protein
MPNLLLVMAGGAIGAALRYETGRLTLRHLGPGFPWGTLAVNLVGGLAMGMLAGWFADRLGVDHPLWLLVGVGILGGFTTFSAFSFDLFAMLEKEQIALAAAYAAGSVLGSLLLLVVGYRFARAVSG